MPALIGGTSGTNLHLYWLAYEARSAPFDSELAREDLPVTYFRHLLLWTVGRRGR